MVNRIKVSIVEDEGIIRSGIVELLDSTEEFECLGDYPHAEAVLDDISKNIPDIIIMDIQLPGMSGIECIVKLKRKYPEIQFLMFTIYEDSDHVYEAIKAGASGYLLKSACNRNILNALTELYHGGSPMNAQIARKLVSAFQKQTLQPKLTADYYISPRESEVLNLLAKGFLYKEIADQLFISVGTVKQHIHKIYDKLHVQNRTEALNKYFNNM